MSEQETVYSQDERFESNDLLLIFFNNTRGKPAKAVVVKDNPPMHGFGRRLKIGDEVEVSGIVCNEIGQFQVAVPSECAFYSYEYFKPADDAWNR